MPRGTDREREVVHVLRRDGYHAWRTRGSKSPVDVFAVKADPLGLPHVKLCQVKSTSRGGPFQAFPPADRDALRRVGQESGAELWLVWWPADRGGARWYAEPDWPSP